MNDLLKGFLQPTVATLLQGAGIMAIDRELAAPLLNLPGMNAAGQPVAAAPPGAGAERPYSVVRGVAALPVRGVLTPNNDQMARWHGWTTYHGLAGLIADVAVAEDVEAVVLEVDSPGGMVMGLEAAGDAIKTLAAVKPVHALVNPMAASAAYWLAAQATDIAVTPGAIVGSIGVGLETYSYTAPSMLFGAQFYSLTSTHARAKWPDAATESGRAEFTRLLDEAEARFHAAVASGRGIPPEDLTTRLSVTADPRDGGAVFYGQDGVSRGLADSVQTREAFYAGLYGRYGAGLAAPKARSNRRAALALAAAAQAKAAI
jgi:capsid assembly protease